MAGVLQLLARAVCAIWFRMDVTGLHGMQGMDTTTALRRLDGGPYVLVGNHSSPFDVLLGIALFGADSRKIRYLIAGRYFGFTWARRLLAYMRAIPVDASAPTTSVRAAVDAVRHEHASVVIMPEGFIPLDDESEFGEIYGGATFVSGITGVPILMVTVAGFRDIWPSTRKLPKLPAPGQRPTVAISLQVLQAVRTTGARDRQKALVEFRDLFRAQMDATRGRLAHQRS